jgi:hypothetical protein
MVNFAHSKNTEKTSSTAGSRKKIRLKSYETAKEGDHIEQNGMNRS